MTDIDANRDSVAVVQGMAEDLPTDILVDGHIAAYTDLAPLAIAAEVEQYYLGYNNNYEDMPD